VSRAAPADPVRIVEAAYSGEHDEGAWLDGMLSNLQGYDVGGGVVGLAIRAAQRTELTTVRVTRGASEEVVHDFERAVSQFPPAFATKIFAPTEFVGNTQYRLARLARESRGPIGAAARTAKDRVPAGWGVIAGDPTTRAVMLYFPSRPGAPPSPDDRFPHAGARALGMVGAHLGAALRLRTLVEPTADDAVLTPAGKVLHAEGTTSTQRTSLVEAVLASERARRRSRRATADEALSEWTALVQGRWTILETVERDGKRLILARRNRFASQDILGLTSDERDVVWLAAYGHSYKYIAYELGCPIATVAGRLRRAMRKLGVADRTELLRKLGLPTPTS
jgi:DNA-binding CsgD family transcriptional regulator